MNKALSNVKRELAKKGVRIEDCTIKAYKFTTINKMFTFLSVLTNNNIRPTVTTNYGASGERKLLMVFINDPGNRVENIAHLYGGVSYNPR